MCFKNRQQVCYHCNVTGHSKKHCHIRQYNTCFNCGKPGHNVAECWENTLITYVFDPTAKYKDNNNPTNHREEGDNPETFSGRAYGDIKSIEEAMDYILTFEPTFYDELARYNYVTATYGEKGKEETKKQQQKKQ